MRRALSAAQGLCGGIALAAGGVAVVVALTRTLSHGVSLGPLLVVFGGLGLIAAAARLIPVARLLAGYSALIYLVLFAPIVVVVVYAFNSGETVALFEGFSAKWFDRALANDAITSAVGRSLRIAASTALVAAILGTAAAIALARMPLRIRLPLDVLVFLNLVVPELMIAVGLTLFFNRTSTPLGISAMMLGHAAFGMSLVILIVRARFVTMGTELERASADLGAGPWATARQITIPQLFPAIGAGALLAFTFSFDDVIISQFNSGSGNQTWPLHILSSLRFGIEPDTNAVATLMLAVTLVALSLAGLLLRRGTRQMSTRS